MDKIEGIFNRLRSKLDQKIEKPSEAQPNFSSMTQYWNMLRRFSNTFLEVYLVPHPEPSNIFDM